MLEAEMWVTCYTDASWAKKSGGGWAVWLRSSEGRVVRQGPCPPYVKDSLEAELSAIYAGVFLAVRTWGSSVAGVLVCSDCQSALELLESGRLPKHKPGAQRLLQRVRALV